MILNPFKRRSEKIRQEALKIAGAAINNARRASKSLYALGGAGSFGGGGGADGGHWYNALDSATSGWNYYVNNWQTRRRARGAYLDQPHFKSIISRQADTVIDRGLMAEAVPDSKALGVTDEFIADWKSQVERGFHRWAISKKSTRTGTMNFYQLQRLAFIGQLRDGEYFSRFYYSKDARLQNPLQLGLVSPDRINGYGLTSTIGYDFSSADGIERNAQGEEIAYHVQVNKGGKYESVRIPATGPKSGKTFMVHGFRPEFDDQTRGYSELFQALQWVQKITDLTDAQLQKEIINASISMYVKPSQAQAASNPFEGFDGNGAGFDDFDNVQTPEDGETASIPVEDNLTCTDMSSTIDFSKPGVNVFNLKEGEDLKPFEYDRKNTEYTAFVDILMEYLSSASGMPLEVLKMKFGENYSASRASLKLFWRVAEQWRMEIATDLLNHVYEAWISGEIAAGRLESPGWSDPRLRAAWLQVNWIGAPEPDIDPSKQADAIGKYLDMGLTTREREARKLNGTSFNDNVKKLAVENPALQAVRIGDVTAEQPEMEEKENKENE